MKKKLLIIEDEANIVEILKIALNEGDYLIDSETDGQRAIEKIKEIKPNLILLDLLLPGKSGIDILSEIYRNPELKNINVVVISAKSGDHDIEYTKALGAKDFLQKPFDIDQLISVIENNL